MNVQTCPSEQVGRRDLMSASAGHSLGQMVRKTGDRKADFTPLNPPLSSHCHSLVLNVPDSKQAVL